MIKKTILMLLVLVGGVMSANADYYVFKNQDSNWVQLGSALTDEDNDGIYSTVINFESEQMLGWGRCTIVLSKENSLGNNWTNVIWANQEASILSSNKFILSDNYTNDGKLYIPITEITPNTYAIRLDYKPDTHELSATRLVEFASDNDNWHGSDPVYLIESSHNSNIFKNIISLPANTQFKFVVNGNSNDKSGVVVWYGHKSDSEYISEDGDNMWVDEEGLYTIEANLNNYKYVAPKLATATATLGQHGYTTFSSEYPLDLDNITNATAFYVAATPTTSVKLVQATGTVAAGEGLVLYGNDATKTVTIPVAASGTAISGNLLVGCPTGTTLNKQTANYSNIYVLVNTAQRAEFQNVNTWISEGNSVSIPAGKAYLQVPTTNGAPSFSLEFDDETTGIANIERTISDNQYYTLDGRRVAQPTKGLYIVNGKKVIIK